MATHWRVIFALALAVLLSQPASAQSVTVVRAARWLDLASGQMTGWAPGILERGAEAGVADGVDAALKAVGYQEKQGARVIKMCATAGVLSLDATVGAQQLSAAEMRTIVEEAARQGLKVAAHAHGTAGIIAAVQQGVASFEDGSVFDEAAITLKKQRGTYLVPTAYAGARPAGGSRRSARQSPDRYSSAGTRVVRHEGRPGGAAGTDAVTGGRMDLT